MVSTKAEVLEIFDKNKMKLNACGVRQICLFGSFLYDQATADSDVDLLVEFDPDMKTFTNFSNLVFFSKSY